jgi:5-methylcytosine-specific restriction endonuclease McrA
VMLLCRPCHDEQHRLDTHRARMKQKTPNESPEPTTPSAVAHLER